METQEQWIEAPEEVRAKCRAICGENDTDNEHNDVFIYRRKEIDTATDMAYQAGLKECEERVREERESLIKDVWAIESAADSFEEGIVVEALRKDVIDLLKHDRCGC